MKRILFIYPDKLFLTFIQELLKANDYETEITTTGIAGFNKSLTFLPDLLIINKNILNPDIKGFITKKELSTNLKNKPMFLIGDFTAKELIEYKEHNVKVFISTPININAFLERLLTFFNIAMPPVVDRTPMLVDIHVKGNIIIIQIEGNFEPNKLIQLNYSIRQHCIINKISSPKFLYVFPSLYPETITKENLELLFAFYKYPEFKIKETQIKILTENKKLIELAKEHPVYSNFEIVPDYISALTVLNIDFDKSKEVPLKFLKANTSYILDLYDDTGMVRIPAMTVITQDMLDYLIKSGETKLTYFSDENIDELVTKVNEVTARNSIDSIYYNLSEYTSLEPLPEVTDIQNDKINLFFRKLKGSGVLIVSQNMDDFEVIKNTFDLFMKSYHLTDNSQIIEEIEKKQCIVVFLDMETKEPTALDMLKMIRAKASRRKVTVIIIAKKIDRITLARFKEHGTDYVIISPFTTSKLLQKSFLFITNDRKT